MGLEAGTYVSDLNEANPVGATDVKAQGDDHLRLIKDVLKNTFPDASKAFYFPKVLAKTSNYSLVDPTDDNSLVTADATGGAFTVTLPALAVGQTFRAVIAKTGTDVNAVTVAPASGTLNGETSLTLNSPRDVLVAEWTGTTWLAWVVRAGIKTRGVTGNTTLTHLDLNGMVVVTPAAESTLTLPSASSYNGRSLIVKRTGTFNVILDGASAETIDGALTYTLSSDKRAVLIIAHGGNWIIVDAFSGSVAGSEAFLSVAQSWTALQTFSKPIVFANQALVDGAAIAWDMSIAPNASVTIAADRSLSNPTGETAGQFGFLTITQPAAGGKDITFGGQYDVRDGDELCPDANSSTVYLYFVRATNDILLRKVWQSAWSTSGWWKEFNLGTYQNNHSFSQAHGLSGLPAHVQFYLKATATNNGYVTGQYIDCAWGAPSFNRGVTTGFDDTDVIARTGQNDFMVMQSGTMQDIDPTKWDLMARVFQ